MHFRLTTTKTLELLAAGDWDINELSGSDDEVYNVVLMPPTDTQFAESDQDSDASDAGAEGGSAHLPRRTMFNQMNER